jgi:hypothetical protein
MPNPIPGQSATILFLYGGERYKACGGNMGNIEGDIRYWLGKSPGMYADELERIVVIPDEPKNDYMYVYSKKLADDAKHEEEMRQQRERNEYERLKKKFEAE